MKPESNETPAAAGFRMPAEWESHEATWLAWPHERSDWPTKFSPVQWVYAEVVRHLVEGERVRILVGSDAVQRSAVSVLRRAGVDLSGVEFFRGSTDRAWTRDYCPTFVKHPGGEVAAINWKFNGWAKYENYHRDAAVSDLLARRLNLRRWKPTVDVDARRKRLVLEGGSIDVNGRGLLLTTEECLLSPVQARNPGLSREALEQALRESLGVRDILWLGEGIAGDDTHGHVDDLARFTDPTTVVIASEDDPADENFAKLKANRARLGTFRNPQGQPLRVVPLPMPAPLFFNGQRLPASYANFYIGNHAVLVPTFNDPQDRIALKTVSELFPMRRVVGIHSVDLVLGLGTLHCMTQQQPASIPDRSAGGAVQRGATAGLT